ncbi:MarR family transcriptional regulator [Latilactobacillus curvatus]|uniref:MarR family transcriptional regulator n=1 Tax=Latilactobacillus curvatus TaxID=28038 RepID=A0AAC9Y0V8_LATCU|nr:MarR family transcriptional regulator [Latilactobacillus curvatus]ASN60749.1 MarR family transcriptional regulator [Latilactobacillus curvatus]
MQAKQSVLLTSQWYLEVQRVTQLLNQLSEQHALSYEQFLVLEHIIELGYNTPSQIAADFKTSAPAATRKLNALQSKQFIRKVHAIGEDQRTVLIELTELGQAAYQGVKKDLAESNIKIKQTDLDHLTAIQ